MAAGAARHVQECSQCGAQLQELDLRQRDLNRLPRHLPRADLWPEILDRVQQERAAGTGRRRRYRLGGLALAASMALAAALYLWLPAGSGDRPPTPESVAMAPDSGEAAQAPGVLPDAGGPEQLAALTAGADEKAAAGDPDLQELISASAYLEDALHAMPRRPQVIRASTTDVITGLQDGVALVDWQLNSGAGRLTRDQSRKLWQQRVNLMNSLVTVRYAETRRVAYQPD